MPHTHIYIWVTYNLENHSHMRYYSCEIIPFKKRLGRQYKKKLGNRLSECARFKVHFDMSHDYDGPKFYKILKHEHHGIGFRSVILIIIACFGLSNQQSGFVPCDRSLNPHNAL